MAYMNQEKKQAFAAELKKLDILKKHNVKYSLAVRNHSTIVCNIKSADLDFIADFKNTVKNNRADYLDNLNYEIKDIQVNTYWLDSHHSGECLEVLQAIKNVLYGQGYYNNSDAMVDYFDVAYYVDINIGKWNKPFTYTKA